MKVHTTKFKEQIKELGRELDSIITFGNTALGVEELNAVTPSFQGGLLKSVMKQLDIDSNVDIPVGTELNYKFGVKVDNEYEYLDFGNYIVYSSEKQEDTMSYKIVCYDKMLKSMVEYEDMALVFPITIRDYLNEIAQFMGLQFANLYEEFTNYNREIPSEIFLKNDGGTLNYTFRDVLDQLAQVVGGVICVNNYDELEVRYIKETNDTIDEEFLKDVNVNFGEKYGPINSIVLSRSGGSDNVYVQDEESIERNGLHELKISDNQIMNFNDRSLYLQGLLNRLNGLEFYINDFVSTGICYYDLYDKYNVKIGENTYQCVLFNDEILVTQGLEENIYTEKPEETQTDYTKADKTDRKINSAYIIVDKRLGEIESRVNSTTEIVGDLESSINYFSVELAQNGLTIPTNNDNTPITSKVYEIPFYGYFKGKQVIPNVSISGNHAGITASSSTTALKFEVKKGEAIGGLSNNYTVTFTYFYGGSNYTTTKNVTIALAPKGTDGTSVNILGSYDSYEALKQAHPTGNIGDAYIVKGDMYVWNEEEQDWIDVGDIQGPAGSPGKDGSNGKSAYQIWLDNGNVGTEEDYLASLKGEKGETGATGPEGPQGQTGEKGDKGDKGDAGETGPQGEKGETGATGQTSYFHIKYSSVANPTSSSQMTETPSEYIGTYVDFAEADSTNPKSYKWSRFQGLQGEQGIAGTNGTNGQTSYLHIKYSNDGGKTFTSNNGETVGDYIGQYTDFNANDSTSVSSYKWSKIKGEVGETGPQGEKGDTGSQGPQGEKGDKGDTGATGATGPEGPKGDTGATGEQGPKGDKGETGSQGPKGDKGDKGETGPQGIQGPAGANGVSTYFYVRYSANSNGSGMTSAPTSTTKYMGTASTTSPTAPTSTSAYTWVEIKGADGQDGSPGQPGDNGLTSYLHIKYSEDGVTFTPAADEYGLGEKPSAWIGQYVDYTEADSENFEDYTWYKFTEDIDDTLNGMQEDISNNKTDIENTKQDLLEELDKKASVENVTTVLNEVKSLQTANSLITKIVEDIQVNGVSQVKQEDIFTLDKNGFHLAETGAKTSSTLDNRGLDVQDTQGSKQDLLYAGYVDDEKARENEGKLKKFEGQTIVYSENMWVDRYMMIGTHSRLEDYEDGTGVFYLGG